MCTIQRSACTGLSQGQCLMCSGAYSPLLWRWVSGFEGENPFLQKNELLLSRTASLTSKALLIGGEILVKRAIVCTGIRNNCFLVKKASMNQSFYQNQKHIPVYLIDASTVNVLQINILRLLYGEGKRLAFPYFKKWTARFYSRLLLFSAYALLVGDAIILVMSRFIYLLTI